MPSTYLFVSSIILLCSAFAAQAADDRKESDRTATLPRVEVIGRPVADGGADVGYRSNTATTTGPWGTRSLQDTPYSITVLPSELIENVSARSVDQLFKMAPLVQAGQSQDVNGIAQATVRGFNVARVYVNGIQNNNLGFGVFVEEIERLEILGGLSGFLYGASPVGGVINYQLKRPTATELRHLTVGNYGGQQYFAHADLGGPIDRENKFGYRLNALYQDGDTAIDNQKLKRGMLSGSLEWRPNADLAFYASLSGKSFRLDGRSFQFFLGGNVPAPLDGTKLYAPKETFVDLESSEADLGMTYKLGENLSLRAAYQRKKDDRAMVFAIGTLRASETEYDLNLFGGRNDALSNGGYIYVDSFFMTGSVQHRLTAGVNGYKYRNRLAIFPTGVPFFFAPPVTVELSNPDADGVTVPDWDLTVSRWVVNGRSSNVNLVVGDDIRLTDRWSLMLGLNRSEIRSRSFDPISGVEISGSRLEKSAVTPSASVLYRPTSFITTYATYIESLEPGAIVESTYSNAGEILEPLKSQQYELGAKANLQSLQLAAALFQIDKSNEQSDDGTPTGTYVQDGRQVHRGLEVSAIGRPVKELAVMAGVTWMDNKVRRTSDPSIEGKQPAGVAGKIFKLYAEYSPGALRGWTLTAGAYFNGDAYQDAANTRELPSYTLFDVGGRYRTQVLGKRVEARINLMNAGNKRYWAATTPGAPRTLAFSLSADL